MVALQGADYDIDSIISIYYNSGKRNCETTIIISGIDREARTKNKSRPEAAVRL